MKPEEYKDWAKLPGQRLKGSEDVRPVVNDSTGAVAGTQTHKWDGRIAADVSAPALVVKMSAKSPTEGVPSE
jgi:hypothetical protein